MNILTDQVWREMWEQYGSKLKVEDGLVNTGKPGHTAEASKAQEAHCGRTTAAYYVVGIALGELDEEQGLHILESLAALQFTDKQDPQYGGFRWYREETRVNDSNAAFFILMPLVVLRLYLEDRVPAAHRELLDQMMDHGAAWFEHELKEPIFYYTNKIVSDGALLLAIARIRRLPHCAQAGIAFFEQWLEYTQQRGWGWGENISLIYIQITMNALRITSVSLQADNPELQERIQSIMEVLVNYVRFHDGFEFVPAIRSYNTQGELHPSSLMWRIAGLGVPSSVEAETGGSLWNGLSYLLFEEELQKESEVSKLPIPRSHAERIMDSSCANTWIGVTGRLGSIDRFPVIAGSYQWSTWGLAWQSYPVSLAVEGHQVSYLRWYAHDGERVRTHPASYQKAYLGPALFKETWYPDTQLRSAQQNHAVLVVRSMSRVHNEASELTDEWVVNRWSGEVRTVAGADGRQWTILQYPHSAVLITPLQGIAFGEAARQVPVIHLVLDGDTLRLRQILYAGETKLIQQARLEAGWAIYYAEGISSVSKATAVAARLSLVEASYKDGEVPRESYMEIRSATLFEGDTKLAELVVDPHKIESGEA
ncbi:hypothetical protein A8709_13980 [Paenibacillus pectinilyticus]|uniref:Heparinase n=1 Tax=Paenibacillus pectinilyticus TaxID=512399 RepID=A0A1C1A3R8_9BACL|nr:hypothetical protein [Paenibacillus pectinilyticus]OCT15207.1 hypothetical protein A8709_13980 [Paenibacillus pectinilyticus]